MAGRPSRLRRLLRALAFAIVCVALLVFDVWAFLRSSWGARIVAAQVEEVISAEIDGTIRIGQVGTFGVLGIRLENVIVFDPFDEPTIGVRELRVKLAPWRLLAGRVAADVTIDGGRVAVIELPLHDDVNIGLAFEPEVPGPEGPDEGPAQLPPDPPFAIELRSLKIDDTAFLYAEGRGLQPLVLVRDISIRAEGSWNDRGAAAELALSAQAHEPVQAPLAGKVQGAFAQNWLDALGVDVTLGDTRLRARGRGEMRALEGRVQVDGTLGAAQARALGIPIAADVGLDADVWLSWGISSVGLRASTEDGGVLAFDGFYRPGQGEIFAQLLLASVDPSVWLVDGPTGSISGSARAAGTLLPGNDLRLSLQLPAAELLGRQVGPIAIAGRLLGEELHLDPSRLQLPGADIRLDGTAAPGSIDLRGTVDATNLAILSAFGAGLLGGAAPPVAGRGTLRFEIEGDPSAPRLVGDLDLPSLSWGKNEARGVELQAHLQPGADGLPVGSLAGTIRLLRTPRTEASGLRIELEREADGVFSAEASATARVRSQTRAGKIHLGAGGRLLANRAELDRFRLDFPQGSLRSEGRSAIDFGAGDFSIEGFTLEQQRGGRLRVSGAVEGRRVTAEIQGRNLRLERLPQALLPEDLAGRLSIDGSVAGTLDAPEGRLRFRLDEGAFATLRDVGAHGDIALGRGRAEGHVTAAVGGVGLVDGDFALPLDLMNAPASTPIQLDLRVGPLDLADLGRTLGAELPEASIIARITGSGPIGRPDLDVELLLSQFEIPDAPELPELAARLAATLHEGVALVEVEAWAASARVLEMEASAPLDPRRIRSEPAEEVERMLRSARSRASGVIRGLDLELVGALLEQENLAGAVVADFDVQGPIIDPRGHVRLEARGGPVGPIQRLNIVSLIELLPDRSRLIAGVEIDAQLPIEIRAEVAAPPRAFIDGTAPPGTPAELFIDLPVLDLAALGGRPTTPQTAALVTEGAGGTTTYAGTVTARGHFRGTLDNLPGSLRLVTQGIVYRGVALGGAELALEQGERLSARLSVIDAAAGTLVATADLDGSVSPLAIARHGEDLFRRMRATVDVQGVDLSLQPLALVSTINRASGQLDIRAAASGPLFELDPVGEISLQKGAIELVGGPRYQDIELEARLTGERLVLARLEASSPGIGKLVAEGRLQRARGPDPFNFEVNADAFPIGGPGGVSARLSGEGTLAGTFDPKDGVVARLEVPQARILLPRTPPRTLQSVSRLDEVVIVSGPEAYLRQRRQRRAQRETALPLELRIDAPRRIFVSGEDVDAELGIELLVRRPETGELVGEGSVRARRGRVRVLGRTFQLEEASAIWAGGPLDNPILSLSARYDAADATAWVDVAGRASSPVISLRSDPPLPESQIALLIASGRTDLPGQAPIGREEPEAGTDIDVAGAAVSVAGSFAAQQLRQAIGPRLPLDVLTLETAGQGTRLEAGTYVSDRLYLGYLRNFLPDDDENRNEVRAEYELSRTVSIESRFGDRGAAGVDLVWEKRIATPAQQRARRELRNEREQRRSSAPPPSGADAPAAFEPESAAPGPAAPEP